jgi:predicted MPP superfamily phosphohydrolase
MIGGTTGPTITSGAAVPASTQPVSSLYLRTGGAAGARLYVSAGGGTWTAVAGV